MTKRIKKKLDKRDGFFHYRDWRYFDGFKRELLECVSDTNELIPLLDSIYEDMSANRSVNQEGGFANE